MYFLLTFLKGHSLSNQDSQWLMMFEQKICQCLQLHKKICLVGSWATRKGDGLSLSRIESLSRIWSSFFTDYLHRISQDPSRDPERACFPLLLGRHGLRHGRRDEEKCKHSPSRRYGSFNWSWAREWLFKCPLAEKNSRLLNMVLTPGTNRAECTLYILHLFLPPPGHPSEFKCSYSQKH